MTLVSYKAIQIELKFECQDISCNLNNLILLVDLCKNMLNYTKISLLNNMKHN